MVDDHSIDFFSPAVGLDAFRLLVFQLHEGFRANAGLRKKGRDKRLPHQAGTAISEFLQA